MSGILSACGGVDRTAALANASFSESQCGLKRDILRWQHSEWVSSWREKVLFGW